MIKCDLHMHTVFCDGKAEPREYVEKAIEKGFECIGFSVHSYVPFDDFYCIGKDRMPEYTSVINGLKKEYEGKIRILCGIEQDYYSEAPVEKFDYIIGSVHYLKTPDGHYGSVDNTPEMLRELCEKYYGGDFYALCEDYYRTVSDVAEKTNCDIIGHFDLITKFCEKESLFDTCNERYIRAYTMALEKLVPLGKPFEINTGAISRRYRITPYPSLDIIKAIGSMGGKFIFSSDAHSPENIGFGFEKFEPWARYFGAELV